MFKSIVLSTILALSITGQAKADNNSAILKIFAPELAQYDRHTELFKECGLSMSPRFKTRFDEIVDHTEGRMNQKLATMLLMQGKSIEDFTYESVSRSFTAEIYRVVKQKNEDMCVVLERNVKRFESQ